MIDPILSAASSLPARLYPCCEFVARIVRAAYALPHVDGSAWWALANVWDGALPWSSAECMWPQPADVLGHNAAPLGCHWHVVQGWRRLSGPGGTVGPGDTGHTWLWLATSPTHGVVLDSTTSRGPRLGGVAFTGQALPPGRPWAERVAAYPAGIAVAVLRPL
jgi:hypothetical protein